MNSLFGMMGIDRSAPDHTTLSRRSQHLDLTRRGVPPDERLHLIVDSTGLSSVGEGEWAAGKHGRRGKRGWKQLPVGVDRSGVLVAQALTEGNADAATTALTLIEAVEGDLASVTADAAYDTIACYAAAGARGANVVVPPTKASSVSRRGRRSIARDRTIRMVKALGRRRWKQEAGYQRQARAENAVFRYKSIIGDGLRARTPEGRMAEALLACNLLNQMTAPGQARVVRHRSVKRLWSGSGRANSDSCTNAVRGRCGRRRGRAGSGRCAPPPRSTRGRARSRPGCAGPRCIGYRRIRSSCKATAIALSRGCAASHSRARRRPAASRSPRRQFRRRGSEIGAAQAGRRW